jgi:hypothetical protein
MVLGPRNTTYQKALDLGTETRLSGTAWVTYNPGLSFFDMICLFSVTYFRRLLGKLGGDSLASRTEAS